MSAPTVAVRSPMMADASVSEPILQALAVVRRYQPDVRLLLVGQAMPHFDAMAAARALGVADLVVIAGFVDTDDLPAYLAASDVVLSLRWPSAHETSASWLRAKASAARRMTGRGARSVSPRTSFTARPSATT